MGCAEDLRGISDQELVALVEEFQSPSEWSNLQLVQKSATEDLRNKAVERVAVLLGRRAVTDIVFHDISLYDHVSEPVKGQNPTENDTLTHLRSRSGDVAFWAATEVALDSGFSVGAGASFQVGIDPSLAGETRTYTYRESSSFLTAATDAGARGTHLGSKGAVLG